MIRLVITDCDGVLTDGRLHYGSDGEKLKVFNVKDGTAIKGIKAMGIKFGVVSGRSSMALQKRADELVFDFCHMGVDHKANVIRALRHDYQLETKEVLYIGDDVNDCSAREECGLLYAVNDAAEEFKEMADTTLETKGGHAVFKEVLKKIHEHQ